MDLNFEETGVENDVDMDSTSMMIDNNNNNNNDNEDSIIDEIEKVKECEDKLLTEKIKTINDNFCRTLKNCDELKCIIKKYKLNISPIQINIPDNLRNDYLSKVDTYKTGKKKKKVCKKMV